VQRLLGTAIPSRLVNTARELTSETRVTLLWRYHW